MYTGYFAKTNEYRKAGLVPVAISRMQPTFFDGPSYDKLKPSWNIITAFKHPELVGPDDASEDAYIKKYYDSVLNRLDPKEVIKELEELAGVDQSKIVLMCYEKPSDFCHRHLVADWLNNYREEKRDVNLGAVTEWKK